MLAGITGYSDILGTHKNGTKLSPSSKIFTAVRSFPDFYSLLEGIRQGLGFAWMPTYMIEDDLKCNHLTPLKMQGQSIHKFDISVLHRQTPKLGPASRFLVDLLQHSPGILPDATDNILNAYPKSEIL